MYIYRVSMASPHWIICSFHRCARDGYTSRWYHLSAGQHFCNECFEYFYRRSLKMTKKNWKKFKKLKWFFLLFSSHKPGHKIYKQWCSVWEKESGGTVQPSARCFLADMLLPVWVQCTSSGCSKWRKLPPQVELYQVKQDIVHCSNCDQVEDSVSPATLHYCE